MERNLKLARIQRISLRQIINRRVVLLRICRIVNLAKLIVGFVVVGRKNGIITPYCLFIFRIVDIVSQHTYRIVPHIAV